MQELTHEKALLLLRNPIINFTEVARRFYHPDTMNAEQKLRRRVYGVETMSKKTLQRLSIIFAELWFLIGDDDIKNQIL